MNYTATVRCQFLENRHIDISGFRNREKGSENRMKVTE